jgi:hypothetical protein
MPLRLGIVDYLGGGAKPLESAEGGSRLAVSPTGVADLRVLARLPSPGRQT